MLFPQTKKRKKYGGQHNKKPWLLGTIFAVILSFATLSFCITLGWSSALYTTTTSLHEHHVILRSSMTSRSSSRRRAFPRQTMSSTIPDKHNNVVMYITTDASNALLSSSKVVQQNTALDSEVQRKIVSVQQQYPQLVRKQEQPKVLFVPKKDAHPKIRSVWLSNTTTTNTTAIIMKEDEISKKSYENRARTVRSRQIEKLRKKQPTLGRSRYHSTNTTTTIHSQSDGNNDNITSNEHDALPYGHVMRQLSQRILSRHIAQSHVLVMAPMKTSSVGATLYHHAKQQGHATHLIDTSSTVYAAVARPRSYLDEWWNSMQHQPSWILLTILDQPSGVFSSPQAASSFLGTSGPTMTYVVFSITATTGGIELPPFNNYTFQGMDTVQHFLNHHYKVQLLSASDFWNSHDLSSIRAEFEHDVFMPNDLITHDNVEIFFKWGAMAATTTKSVVSNRNRDDEEIENTKSDSEPAIFKAYLFATQGLDLAIPSRREYIVDGTLRKVRHWLFPYGAPSMDDERRHIVESVVDFKTCPLEHNILDIRFHGFAVDPWDAVIVKCDGVDVTARARLYDSVRLWTNTGEGMHAESVCIQLDCNILVPKAAAQNRSSITKSSPLKRHTSCDTRILKSATASSSSFIHNKTSTDKNKNAAAPPNILVLMIDPISRPQFEFIMPRTYTMMRDAFNFTSFPNYATVGNNSGPNQMALYSGKRLERRDGIAQAKGQWIWDQLNKLGYATFKAEDGCIANSNMVQSILPHTHHGQALHELFCFHFARPNCVGGRLAADYLLNHTEQFIDTYSSSQRWAAFVSLVDTHEDTMTLGAVIDESVSRFLNKTIQSHSLTHNTAIFLVSDHGLHYGPYFQSLEGERERSQPILYMRMPDEMNFTSQVQSNVDKWVTPFDVHATLLNIVGLPHEEIADGESLLQNLTSRREHCHDVPLIPKRHCELLEPTGAFKLDRRKMPSPPSLLSFYADIRKEHRLQNSPCPSLWQTIDDFFESRIIQKGMGKEVPQCKCATNARDWFHCDTHPWGSTNSTHSPHEHFLMLDCDGQRLQFETRLIRWDSHANPRKKIRAANKVPPPNILFLEVDSVSVEYANRHFPRTRELLRRYQKCHDGLCAVDFSRFSVVGPNSISNQVASLSGCFTTLRHESCFDESDVQNSIGTICRDSMLFEHGMYLKSTNPGLHHVYCPYNHTEPFVYDVAQKLGYVTFFGEEFCYSGSPWVVQDNVFPMKANINLQEVFCRLSKRDHPETDDKLLYKYSHQGRCVGETVKHKIGLDLIRQMWDAYEDEPKFAYINALVAHDYSSLTPKLGLTSEEYDEELAMLLETFLKRPDAKKTIIVVRSDHGLQGGKAAPIDYSTQIEQKHPWTEMIVPDLYPVETLRANSDKLVTPFDLYTTLRDLMVQRQGQHPDWTHNLMTESISSTRSCEQSKVLPENCASSFIPYPTFGVCNMYETAQAIFCRDPTNGGVLFKNRKAYEFERGNGLLAKRRAVYKSLDPFVLMANKLQDDSTD